MKTIRLSACFVFLASLVLAISAQAQTATGAIEGRVKSAVTGESLKSARVVLKGTAQQVFTDESGAFRLDSVPAGTATLRVFSTGLDEQEVTVNVAAGQTATQDVSLGAKGPTANEELVKLDPFTVQSTKETNAQAIAVNEQRFHSNITSVVSTDEFGTLVDRNPGEILKYLPGIDVETFANNIVGVSVRGLGSNNTELNFDGMPIASMNAEGVGRGFEVQFASAADISRVEVRKVPLPEDSANSLGGSINMIRKSAFEYSQRQISYRVLARSDGEKFTLKDMDGPKDRHYNRWQPNWELSWVEPLNKNLGFAVTVGENRTVVNTHWSLPGWNVGSTANNTAALTALAAGQAYNHPSLYTPAIQNPLNHNAPLAQGNLYAMTRVDWRPFRELTLGATISGSDGWKQVADDIRYQWNAAATGSGDSARFNDRYTSLGRLGGAQAFHSSPLWRDISAPTLSGLVEATWRKNGWIASAKGSVSESRYQYRDTEDGFFNSTTVGSVTGLTNVPETGIGSGTANPVSLTMNFYDINYWGPKRIESFTTANGLAPAGAAATDPNSWSVPVDWSKNANIKIGGARARPGYGKEYVTAAKTYVKRNFTFGENPLTLQAGLDWSERYRFRRYQYNTWRFIGPDASLASGIAAGTATSLLASQNYGTLIGAENIFARRDSQYNYPAIERISMSKYYKMFQDHPTWFQYDADRSARLGLTSNAAYDLTETLTAPYAQFDARLFHGRLRLTGGVRYENLDASAHGLLHTQTNAYQKYSDGTVKRSGDVVNATTGLPTTRAGNPVYLPGVTQGSLAETLLTYKERGARGNGGNKGTYPSLHSVYSITDNLQLQLAYARTQSRLDYTNVVVPSNDVSDTPVTSGTGTGALGTITIRNPNLKPETVDNYESRLTYFNHSGGLVGLGFFRKSIKDFNVQATSAPMTASDLQAFQAMFPDADLSSQYLNYAITTRYNGGDAQLDGVEFEFRQSLDPLIGRWQWARGFSLTGSVNHTKRTGANAGDLGNNRPWRGTLAGSYRSRKLSVTIGYNYNGELTENANLTSNGVSGTQVLVRQNIVDFNATYRLSKYFNFFFAGSNVLNELRAREQRYPGRPTWGSMTSSNTFGKTFTVGVTGSFNDVPWRL